MKRFLLLAIVTIPLLLVQHDADAQRGRYHRSYGIYRSRPMVSVGIGAGYYGTRIWGYGHGPGVGVRVGVLVPPPGAKVRALPPDAAQTEINGITYYQHQDLYFRERKEGGFERVEAPVGARLNRLPAGATLKKIDGKDYYEKDGTIFYKWDEEGSSSYEIVGKNGILEADQEYDEEAFVQEPQAIDQPDVEEGAPHSMQDEADSTATKMAHPVLPQIGDQFDHLPRDSKAVRANGTPQYVSPNGIYYQEKTIEGETIYEVVRVN